jgi:hypothetical protein
MRYSAHLQIDNYGIQQNNAKDEFLVEKKIFQMLHRTVCFEVQK